jgi:hypothetical protein
LDLLKFFVGPRFVMVSKNLPIPLLGTAHHDLDIWHTVG